MGNHPSRYFGFRLGPYWQIPVTEKFSASLSGGLALLEIHSTFSFDQRVTIAGAGSRSTSGRGSRRDLLPGAYLGGMLRYDLTPDWDVFCGAQYQTVGEYSQKVKEQVAKLDLGNAVFVTVGIGFSF